MKFLQLPKEVLDVARSSQGLQSALNRLEYGTEDTPRSWFYESKDPDDIIQPVIHALDGMQDLLQIAEWDKSRIEKYAPQGGSSPLVDRVDLFEEYFNHLAKPEIIEDRLWIDAKALAIKTLGFNESGDPMTIEQVLARGLGEDKYNTNSGWRLYKKRKSPEALDEARHCATPAVCILEKYPCTLGTRATMGKTGTKARSIFMASMSVNVCGQRYQMVLQDYLRTKGVEFFIPWEGWDHVQNRVSLLWDDALKFGADYSKMDQHFNSWHGAEMFDVIKHYFKPCWWDELQQIISYVFEVPIITNLGFVDEMHAMPSGSEWTNFLETMWNYVFNLYLQLKYHVKMKGAMGIGDDQLWFISCDWHEKQVQHFVELVCDEFSYAGLPGNPEKQEVDFTHTGFLQRRFDDNWNGNNGQIRAAGVYSLVRNTTSQVYPERWHNPKKWNADMFALRCIMIAENCVQHPLFNWYIKEFVAKANPHILEWARKSVPDQRRDVVKARGIAGFLPTYNQEKLGSDITSFQVVRLLKEV